jgi:chemotaxis protein CheC
MNMDFRRNSLVHDALLELVNIGVGRAASGLSELTGREVSISVPTLELTEVGCAGLPNDLAAAITLRVSQSFAGGLRGHALVVLNRFGAVRLAHLLLGKTTTDDAFDDNEQGALLELGNIIMGNVVGAVATELNAPVEYQLPQLQLCGIDSFLDLLSDLAPIGGEVRLLIMRATLNIRDDRVSGYLMLLFEEAELQNLLSKLERLVTS